MELYNICVTKTGEILKSFESKKTAKLWRQCWDSYPSTCKVVKATKLKVVA